MWQRLFSWTAVLWAAVVVSLPAVAAAEDLSIRGTVTVAPMLQGLVAEGDRLIIKIYHPKNDVELDATYRILPRFSLPQAFRISPSLDMNRSAKWQAYQVEIFTDKDGDILNVADGEIRGQSPGLVPVGTPALDLILDQRR